MNASSSLSPNRSSNSCCVRRSSMSQVSSDSSSDDDDSSESLNLATYNCLQSYPCCWICQSSESSSSPSSPGMSSQASFTHVVTMDTLGLFRLPTFCQLLVICTYTSHPFLSHSVFEKACLAPHPEVAALM